MGMVVRTNTMALNAYRQLGMNNNAVSKSLEKLSSGFRINRAGDDAAGLAISEKMKAQITGLETASANAQDGISLIQTAEGNLNEVHDMLNRMVELATKSANGTYTQTERDALQLEVDQLLEEIDRISQSANFNGTKLLDGSLSATPDNTSIKIQGGFTPEKSGPTTGKFTQHTPIGTGDVPVSANVIAGDTISFTVALDDGTSYTSKFTWASDKDGNPTKLLNSKGEEVYAASGTMGNISNTDLTTLIKEDLQKTALGEKFTISVSTNNSLEFETKTTGSKDTVKALGYEFTEGGVHISALGAGAIEVDADVNAALSEGYEIKAENLIEYDGTNYDDAVFTINGKKFVLMTEDHTGASLNDSPNTNSMHATFGLGDDVTILIGGTAGLTAADDNFKQNIAKIAEVTGLKVTDAIDETDYGADSANGIDAGEGIRLSAGDGATGGLVLQIGDTADDFNKLRVSIEDMSAKGLKLKDLSVTTADEASSAINRIKNAINTVSTTRANMGALQNRLEHTINNLDVSVENLSAANSRIRDTDMAKEMMNYTKMNVLVQSAQAMLAQANQQPQSVLQLLQ